MLFEKRNRVFIGRFPDLHTGPLVHGFSTRKGGHSRPPYDSLNLGGKTADDPADVEKNRRDFFRSMQIRLEDVAMPLQVHGARIVQAERGGIYPATDGLITDSPGLVLSVLVADCLSIFLYDPDRPAVGLVHAGWRGSSMNIGAKAVEAMAKGFRSEPGRLRAWMGPSIGPCCYEVGEEVASQFPAACVKNNHLDLWTCNRLQLESAGLQANAIEIASLCTKCHPELFYSHRGSGGKAGRMMAVFGL